MQKFSTGKEKVVVAHGDHASLLATEKDSIDEAIEAALKKCSSTNSDKIGSRKDSIDEVIEATVLKYSSPGRSPTDVATGGQGRKQRRRTKSESLVGSIPDRLHVRSPSREDSAGRRRKQKGKETQGEKSFPAGSGTSSEKSSGRKSNEGGKGFSPQLPLDSLVPLTSSDDEDTGIGNEGDFSDDDCHFSDDNLTLVRTEQHLSVSRFNNSGKRAVCQKKSRTVSSSTKVEAQTNTEMLTEVVPPVNRSDFETQVDLPSGVGVGVPVKKTATFDVGIQVDPADTLEFITAHSSKQFPANVVTSSEIAIQATGPDDGDAVAPPSASVDSDHSPHQCHEVGSEADPSQNEHPSGQDSPVKQTPIVERSEAVDSDERTALAVLQEVVVRPHTSVIRHTTVGQTSAVTQHSGDHPTIDHRITTDSKSSRSVKVDSAEITDQREQQTVCLTGHRTGRIRTLQQARKVNYDVSSERSDKISEKRRLRGLRKSVTKPAVDTSDLTMTSAADTAKQPVTDTPNKSADLFTVVSTTDCVNVEDLTVTKHQADETVDGCAECAALQRPVRGHGRRGRRRLSRARKPGGATVESNCVVMLDRLETMPAEGMNLRKPARGRTKLGREHDHGEVTSTETVSVEGAVVPSEQDSENMHSAIENETDRVLSSDDHNEVDDDRDGGAVAMDTTEQGASQTNSEYEPLPIQQQLKRRKRRIWPGHDMGYSKPRRKRRRKKQAMPADRADASVVVSDEETYETRYVVVIIEMFL